MPPLLPGYTYADTPHELTVQRSGYRYGCSSARNGDTRPRGMKTIYIAHPWSANAGRTVTTQWLDMACGHSERETDPACTGCANQHNPPT